MVVTPVYIEGRGGTHYHQSRIPLLLPDRRNSESAGGRFIWPGLSGGRRRVEAADSLYKIARAQQDSINKGPALPDIAQASQTLLYVLAYGPYLFCVSKDK